MLEFCTAYLVLLESGLGLVYQIIKRNIVGSLQKIDAKEFPPTGYIFFGNFKKNRIPGRFLSSVNTLRHASL